MKTHKVLITIIVLVVFIGVVFAVEEKTASPTSSNTEFVENHRDILKGLKYITVIIMSLEPEVEKNGLTKQQLQTDVELRFRQNGITVFSEESPQAKPDLASGIFYLKVETNIREGIPITGVCVEVELHELVFLRRDPTKMCLATTWSSDLIGTVGVTDIKSIREDVKDLVDKFINDYLAVNPIERTVEKKAETTKNGSTP